jgi:hypothetical protein
VASSIPVAFYSTFKRISKRKTSKMITTSALALTFKRSLSVSGAVLSHRTVFDFSTELKEGRLVEQYPFALLLNLKHSAKQRGQ